MAKGLGLFIVLFIYSAFSYAEYEQVSVQLGVAPFSGAYNIQFKALDKKSGWALVGAGYRQESLFTGYSDRETGMEFDPTFNTLAVSKLWSAPYAWGYADVGVGLGIGKGEWLDNCEDTEPDLLGSSRECDVHKGTRIGVPLQASAVFGKYVGIGVSLNVFIQKDKMHSQLLFIIPLGKFTK